MVMGGSTRTRLLYALLEVGELCVCDLAAAIDTAESTVSHSLRWLRTAGIVRARRAGRMTYYSLDSDLSGCCSTSDASICATAREIADGSRSRPWLPGVDLVSGLGKIRS